MRKPKRKFRLIVNPEERVQATPETLAKAKGCIIRKLYEAQVIDGQEQDAALEIVEAFTFITSALGIRPLLLDGLDKGHASLNERAVRMWDQYLSWGRWLTDCKHIRPHVVVEWLTMERQMEPECIGLDKAGNRVVVIGRDGKPSYQPGILQTALREWSRRAPAAKLYA